MNSLKLSIHTRNSENTKQDKCPQFFTSVDYFQTTESQKKKKNPERSWGPGSRGRENLTSRTMISIILDLSSEIKKYLNYWKKKTPTESLYPVSEGEIKALR